MAVDLPNLPRTAVCQPRLIRAGGVQQSAFGGADLDLGRLGDRFAVDVEIPALSEADAKAWIAARLRAAATRQTLRLVFPQVRPKHVGVLTVNGSGQVGTNLNVTGGAAGVELKAGEFFSTTDGARTDLFCLTADVTLNGGARALTIAPRLRRSPANGAYCVFQGAVIEGFVEGNVEWRLEALRFTGLSFTLRENK